MMIPRNVLIVDPDRSSAAGLEKLLRDGGCEWAATVASAGNALRDRTAIVPELILLSVDPATPSAAITEARSLRQGLAVPVVLVADAASLQVLQKATELSPCSYIRKPVDPREFWLVIEANRKIASVENRMRQLEIKMQEAQRFEGIGVLAGGVVHDFNNLLTGIFGGVALARLELPPGSPVEARLDQIDRAANRAAELCQRLLAHISRGGGNSRMLAVDALVEETVSLLKTSLKPDIAIQIGSTGKLPPIRSEEAPLRQVLTNLITNAAEAIGDAAGMIRVVTFTRKLDAEALARLQFAGEAKPGDFVVIEVADTGCGMDADTLQQIFDPVFTTKAAGRGLGLAAVARIVRKQRGGLQVESAPRQGSAFRVFLPVASENEGTAAGTAAPMAAPASAPAQGVCAAGGTILIVDDDDAVRALAKWVVERAGYRAVDARDGSEALKAFKTDPGAFRLVLLDLTMPRMSGAEVLVGLRAIRPSVPVVIITGHGEDSLDDKEFEGVKGFLQKPFAPDTLRAILSRNVPITTAG